MSRNQYDHFNVILTGKIHSGHTRNNTIKRVARQLALSTDELLPLIQGEKTIFKQNISHAEAYTYQQQLNQCGLEASIERVNQPDIAPAFSLVPEGEEQTSYAELTQRYQNGEQVVCKHCNAQQTLTPYCDNCGKPLVAKAIKQVEVKRSPMITITQLSGMLILFVSLVNCLLLLLQLPALVEQFWLSAGLGALGLVLLWYAKRQLK